MYLCLCKGLTEFDVQQLCQKTAPRAEALASSLGLDDDDCCGRCARNIQEFLSLSTRVSTLS
jgi:bacterioferritin-associated ferredoxin